MFFNALDDAGGDVCQCCLCLCLRGEQQMNVISWSAWSRITTTRTDPGSTPTGTWLWREQASINRVRRPARARRPSCFCPCQPSAEGEMLSNTERERQTTDHWLTNLTPRWAHPVRKKRFYLGTLPKQMHLESITGFICSCSVTLEISAISSEEAFVNSDRRDMISDPTFQNTVLFHLIPSSKGRRVGSESSLICTKPALFLAGMFFVRLQNVSLL